MAISNIKQDELLTLDDIVFTHNNFDDYIKIMGIENLDSSSVSSLIKFIGYFEGNGYFNYNYTTKGTGIEITLYRPKRSQSFLMDLKNNVLGFGEVYFCETDNRFVLSISGKEDIFKIIHLLNGNLSSLYALNEFQTFLNVYNERYNTSISFKPTLVDINLSTSWLSGFIDSTGFFSCHTTIKRNLDGVQILKRRRNDHKDFINEDHLDFRDKSYKFSIKFNICHCDRHIIESIRDVLKTKKKIFVHYNDDFDQPSYEFDTSSKVVVKKIKKYLNKPENFLETPENIEILSSWLNLFEDMNMDIHKENPQEFYNDVKIFNKLNKRLNVFGEV